jgi:hypothetical protein
MAERHHAFERAPLEEPFNLPYGMDTLKTARDSSGEQQGEPTALQLAQNLVNMGGLG